MADFFHFHSHLSAAVAQRPFAAGAINENPPHGFRGCGEKMRAVLPAGIAVADEAQPGFMDKCGWLQRLARGFVGHLVGGQPAQFFVDQRQQFVRRMFLPGANRNKELGHWFLRLVHKCVSRPWLAEHSVPDFRLGNC